MDRTDLLRKDPSPPSGNRQNDPVETLDAVAAFLRRFLVCDEHQITILTLWIAHTWCYSQLLTTAYLDIRSPESQSGKSRCLDLLRALCNAPLFATGSNPRTIRNRLLQRRSMNEVLTQDRKIAIPPPHTLLLDNCHLLFGPAERQLVAMLNSGIRQASVYAFGDADYCLFGPKAFAGYGRLPRSLAELCIPIVLRRKKPSETVARFNRDEDHLPANIMDGLRQLLHHPHLSSEETLQPPPRLPSELTAHQQDCAEPILHLADAVGGPWPEKARIAISAVFQMSYSTDSIQVLSDIRAWFYMKNNPEYLLSRDLLALLTSMEQRPWSGWTSKSGRKLGSLLNPFSIFSRNLTVGDEKNLKGYLFSDFSDSWERYLPPLVVENKTTPAVQAKP